WLLLFEQFQHPNGQLPAYEWEFSDLNPPVHAWACWRVYSLEKARTGRCDREFLERSFHKLLINFAWWVNKVDSQGMNVFEGGFFYDVLRYPDGRFHKFQVRSLVGLIPLYAVEMIDEDEVSGLPVFLSDVKWFIRNRPDLVGQACFSDRVHGRTRHVLSIVDG